MSLGSALNPLGIMDCRMSLPGLQEALATAGELRSILPLGVRVVIQLHKIPCREYEGRRS